MLSTAQQTLIELANDAINVQNTCNIMGVSLSFAEVMPQLRAALEATGVTADTRTISEHPITRLWASKIHDLAGMGLSDLDRYGEAYDACKKLAGIE